MFSTIDELWQSTIKDLVEYGKTQHSRNGKTQEIIGYQAQLSGIDRSFLLNTRRKLSPYYACAEALWYFDCDDSIEMISAYAPQYAKFAEDGKAFGAYGARMWSNLKWRASQLDLVVKNLLQDKDSRQTILTLWTATDLEHALARDHKDLPCTISMQFLIRDAKLHLIVTMRSNDVWLGLPYDIFAFTCIQQVVAAALNIEAGTYTHQAGSIHLYEKHHDAAEEACQLRYKAVKYYREQHDWSLDSEWTTDRKTAVFAEKLARDNDTNRAIDTWSQIKNETLKDLVAVCGNKWHVKIPIQSSSLKIALQFEEK